MNLFNTLSRQIEEVKPQNSPEVTVYTCGPTVYDYAHVGHWFNYVRMDTLIRTLKAVGLKPNWVMNITDVGHLTSDADTGEDKLEKGAKREGKTAWEIAEFYAKDFMQGMRALNNLEPTNIVKATDHIDDQIALIQTLESKGYTYIIDDGVYYDTSKFPDYAKFARLDLSEQQSTDRVIQNPQKKQASDFALWKFSPKDQHRDMEWDSPWGKGFPGWHIECSAMSMKYLGETLDIHTGGIDHVPVHHTNEIAQSEAATGKRFANLWLHSNHVMINGEKISKSLGNGIRLQDLDQKGILTMALRLHVLESHYRNQSKFTWESLQAAQNRLQDLYAMAALIWQSTENSAMTADFSKFKSDLLNALSNDLDTPRALMLISELSNAVQQTGISTEYSAEFINTLQYIDELLGLDLSKVQDLDETQKALIRQREEARQAKDWDLSDKLRDQLATQGIELRDVDKGTIWTRLVRSKVRHPHQ